MRTHDVFDRPICSAPGPYIDVMLRKFSLMKMEQPLTGETTRCLNLGSYNYLGFADDWMRTRGAASNQNPRRASRGSFPPARVETQVETSARRRFAVARCRLFRCDAGYLR